MIDGRWLRQQQRLLVARHTRRLGRSLAEDLASEAALRCLRRPAPDGRHGPWLECIFRNLLADHHRRCARRDPGLDPAVAATPTPEDVVLRDERHRMIALAWNTIQPDQRAAIEARINDEEDRFAQSAGVARETIRTRIHRGLAALRRTVARLGGFVPGWLSSALHPVTATTLPAVASLALMMAAPQKAVEHQPVAPVLAQAPSVQLRRPTRSPDAESPLSGTAPTKAKQPRPGSATATPTPATSVKRFDFDTDELTGDRQRPDGDFLLGPAARAPHVSLIDVPDSFVPAIVRSLEDL